MSFKKKAQINKIFVYVSSVILILFAGFLVTKFIYVFQGDISTKVESEIYSKLEKDYNSVFKSYGSEKEIKYRLTSNVKYICFISNQTCFDTLTKEELNVTGNGIQSLKTIYEAGDNVALFGINDIINSQNIGKFIIRGNGCTCLKPNNNYIDIALENYNNQVYIFENN